MRTFYEGHDRAYRAKQARGEEGWTSLGEATENFGRIRGVLPVSSLSPQCRILDLGCGSGELSGFYAGLSQQVTGIDISPTAIAWARQRLPHLRFLCGNALNPALLPLGRYDLVIDSNCLHCIIGKDRTTLLANIAGWLKTGGHLVLHTMCNEPVGDLLQGYHEADRTIYHGEIATRYLGKAEDILAEVEAAGFTCLRSTVHSQDNGPDMLVSLHQNEAR